MKLRIMIREEGDFMNAYMAKADTLEGAQLLGSIIRGAAIRDDKVFDLFKALMTLAMLNAVKGIGGKVVGITEEVPPGHEKTRNAG